jgi:hypothetical protein
VSMRILIPGQPIFAQQMLAFAIRRIPRCQFQFSDPLLGKTLLLAIRIFCEILQALFNQAGDAAPALVSNGSCPCYYLGINRQVNSSFHMRIITHNAYRVNEGKRHSQFRDRRCKRLKLSHLDTGIRSLKYSGFWIYPVISGTREEPKRSKAEGRKCMPFVL